MEFGLLSACHTCTINCVENAKTPTQNSWKEMGEEA